MSTDFEPAAKHVRNTASSGTNSPAVMQTFYNFFHSDATLWSVDKEATDPNDGFCVTPNDGSLTFQVNFRPNGNSVWIGIDWDGSIVDPSDPEASAGDYSPEMSFGVSFGVNGWVFYEWDDTFSLFQQDHVNPVHAVEGAHVGMIFIPFLGSDVGNGMTGIGMIGGDPNISTASGDWLTSHSSAKSYARVKDQTWTRIRTIYGDFSNGASSALGRVEPIPVPISELSTNRPLGVLKYIFGWDVDVTPFTVLRDTTNSKEFFFLSDNAQEEWTLHPQPYGADPRDTGA